MAIMREQSDRGGDHSLSIPKVERDLPAVWAKSLIDIFAKLGTTNALEGLAQAVRAASTSARRRRAASESMIPNEEALGLR